MKIRLVWLLLCCIWGSTWLFIKLGLQDLPPLTFAGIRFVIACTILTSLIIARHIALPRQARDWLLLAITGLLSFTLNYGLLFWGEQYISSGLAALLQATIPVFGLIIAHFHLPAEQLTGVKVVGVVLGILGVAVIFSDQLSVSGPGALAGSIALVIGSMCAAYSNVLVKAHGRNLNPATLAAGQMFFGLIPLLLYGLAREGSPLNFHWTKMAIIALFYLAIVGTVIAFLMYYWLVHHMDVTKTMLIALVTPGIAVILGVLILHEELSWRIFAGGTMIMSGIGLMVLRRFRRQGVKFVSTG